ncbi:MAG: flavodoxin [Methanobrevibacter boviskoreani]|uniref:flavodoxin n=1 Tax=Methanobrevibacter boviskoreani TaxID=1348249 RepID=UPI003D8CD924
MKEFIDADTFQVETKESYPDSYMETIEIAKKEQENNVYPELKEYLDDISQYDTIYIVSPNWWGTLPMPLQGQLKQLDFTGKTVKTLITHEGSGLGNSMKDIKSFVMVQILKMDLILKVPMYKKLKMKLKNGLNISLNKN